MSVAIRDGWSARTKEERRAIALARAATKTLEQRRGSARKAVAARTPEQWQALLQGRAKMTATQLSEAAHKAWATRRANAAKEAAE